MRCLVTAVLSLIPASAGAVAVEQPKILKGLPAQAAECPGTISYYAYNPDAPLKPQKLGELPPANVYAAVLRHDGRCQIPVVIRYGVGRR